MASFSLSSRLAVSSPLFVSQRLQFFSHLLIRFDSGLCPPRRCFSSLLLDEKTGRFSTNKLQAKFTSGPKEFVVPKNFPFDINENVTNDGTSKILNVTFKRNSSYEQIKVELNSHSWPLEEEDEEEVDDNGNNSEQEDDDSEMNEEDYYCSAFTVEIDKGNKRKLMFHIRYPEKFRVYKLEVWYNQYFRESEVYDAELLVAAQKCLEARGIDVNFAKLAEKYIVYMNRKYQV